MRSIHIVHNPASTVDAWAGWLENGARERLTRWLDAAPPTDAPDADLFYVLDADGEIAGVGATPGDAMNDYVRTLCDVLLDPAAAARAFQEGPWTSPEEMLLDYCTGVEIRQLSAAALRSVQPDEIAH